MNKVICLHELDNVAVALSNLKKGDVISCNSINIELLDDIDFGHKVALKSINKNENIIKYGVSIGVVTVSILKGSHVHSHNIKSLYLNKFSKE